MVDVAIIGSGVAGLTAGIFIGRANKTVTIIEENNLGGTTATLKDIKNFPGYITIDGIDLIMNMQMQCINFGVNFEFSSIKNIDFKNNTITFSDNKSLKYKTLIVASGMSPNKLNIENEDKFKFKGLSYCAVCDGSLYKNKKIAVFTNNNSAKGTIMYLSNISKDIKVFDFSNNCDCGFETYHNIIPVKIIGDNVVKSIVVKINDEEKIFDCDGIFVALGKSSNLSLFKGELDIKNNQILSNADMHTNIENVFVAGDVRNKSLKQIITACSDGAIAGTQAIKFLSSIK